MSGVLYHQFEHGLLKSLATLAEAAKTAADAYAKKVEQPTVVLNISHEGNVHTAEDITAAVQRVLRNGRVQDR